MDGKQSKKYNKVKKRIFKFTYAANAFCTKKIMQQKNKDNIAITIISIK
jgi:hypothetical protein